MQGEKIAVIGAGAAGMMAAYRAASLGGDVTVFEKNNMFGKKIRITGKGRCNITNACDNDEFIRNIPTNGRFMYSSLNGFTPWDTIDFFESHGLKTKIERGNRVFPVSDKAADVAMTLHKAATEAGAVFSGHKVTDVLAESGEITGLVLEKGEKRSFQKVIIATGGKSYPLTGSTGDGYAFAQKLGHTIIPLKPSLVPIESPDKFCRDMQGLSLKNTGMTVINADSGKEVFRDFGEMLFTHFGISGPMVLSAGANIKNPDKTKYVIYLDLKPALSEEKLDQRILRDFEKNINKAVSNSLGELLPRKMIPVVLNRWGISFDTKCNSVTREQRTALVKLLKSFSINVKGFRPIEEAIVTSGGVCTKEINPSTMESRIVKGLYFAGEVIDVDGYTGGFNLQIAFSTGWAAGESCL